MTASIRVRNRALALLVLLCGALLALAWWNWLYPEPLRDLWNGVPVYAFYWRQLEWALAVSAILCLGLWGLSTYLSRGDPGAAMRAAQPFLLSLLASAFFARYSFHPLGVQFGSSVWTYGLVSVTSGVAAFPLSKIVRAAVRTRFLQRHGWAIVCVLAALYAALFGFLSVARHDSFRSHALDLGTMDQAAWNTIHGRILERTPLYRNPAEGSRYENRLLDAKLELLFIPLSALYVLWADPRVLLIVQTLFLAAGALPLFKIVAEHDLGGAQSPDQRAQARLLAVLLSAAYLLYLPLHYINMADFHPSALMVPLLIAAWWAMVRRRWRAYYVWLALALSCRIDAAFAVLALGTVIAIWQRGHRRHGLYTIALAAAWLAADFFLVVPLARTFYPSSGDLVSRRFGSLGSGPIEILRTLITRPSSVLTQFADRDKLQTLFDLLTPLGFLPLLNPLAFAPALPILAINLLAESAWQNSIHAHYMAPALPFVWIAAGEGLIWLLRARPRRHDPAGAAGHEVVDPGAPLRFRLASLLATFALLNTALVAFTFSPFPPGRSFYLANFFQPSSYTANLGAIVALIPDDASVCAQSDIHPHVSQRRDASLFPRCRLEGSEAAEYVILDLDATSTKSPLGYHAFYQLVDAWLMREDYGVVAQQGGILLLRRGAPRDNIPQILSNLDTYGRDFYRVGWEGARLSPALKAGELYRVPVVVRNTGSQCWHSKGQLPVRLSYRWWTNDEALLLIDARRTDLPCRVEPGHQVRLDAWLLAPDEPGTYTLEWDMLREGDAWFGDMGAEMLRQVITVE
jgi:uncharacterized membrane protein